MIGRGHPQASNAEFMWPSAAYIHLMLDLTYDALGRYTEAITEYEASIRLGRDITSTQCYLGFALAKAGRRNEAESILNKLRTSKEYVSPAELAIL